MVSKLFVSNGLQEQVVGYLAGLGYVFVEIRLAKGRLHKTL